MYTANFSQKICCIQLNIACMRRCVGRPVSLPTFGYRMRDMHSMRMMKLRIILFLAWSFVRDLKAFLLLRL